MKLNDNESPILVPRPTSMSKYVPHQGRREARRRLRQISAGSLTESNGATLAARYVAAGLIDPTEAYFIKK